MKHGESSLDTNVDTTFTCVDSFVARALVQSNTLGVSPVPGGFEVDGELLFLGGIVVTIWKVVSTQRYSPAGDPIVRTTRYSYNASVRHHHTFLRYDNSHSWPGHPDEHHKHERDWSVGVPPGTDNVTWVGELNFPHVSEFLDEVEHWYYRKYAVLPNPTGFPSPGRNSRP